MKSVQVRRNHTPKTSSNQSRNGKVPVDSRFALPPSDAHPACLCYFNREQQTPVSLIPFTDQEFTAVIEAPLKYRQYMQPGRNLIREAILEKLERLAEGNHHEDAPVPPAPSLVGDATRDQENQTPAKVIPAQVAAEAEAALVELERVGSAAIAFAMLKGWEFKKSIRQIGGWEEVEMPGLSQGCLEMARIICVGFNKALMSFASASRLAIGRIQEAKNPVVMADHCAAFYKLNPDASLPDLDNSVHALLDCLTLQFITENNGPSLIYVHGAVDISESLKEAWHRFEESFKRLSCTYTAMAGADWQAVTEPTQERRAA